MEQSPCLRLLLEGERGGTERGGTAWWGSISFISSKRTIKQVHSSPIGHNFDYVQSQHYGNLPALPLCVLSPLGSGPCTNSEIPNILKVRYILEK